MFRESRKDELVRGRKDRSRRKKGDVKGDKRKG